MPLPTDSSQPFLERKLKIQDTCGIHNLHAMPGVIGGIVGAITAASATEGVYGEEGCVPDALGFTCHAVLKDANSQTVVFLLPCLG